MARNEVGIVRTTRREVVGLLTGLDPSPTAPISFACLRMGDRAVEGTNLENRQTGNRLVGSNSTPSDSFIFTGVRLRRARRRGSARNLPQGRETLLFSALASGAEMMTAGLAHRMR